MGDRRVAHRSLVGKPDENRPLGKPKHRWVGNIEIYLQVMGCVEWTGSSWLKIGTGGGYL
jgi:hypothetical protein